MSFLNINNSLNDYNYLSTAPYEAHTFDTRYQYPFNAPVNPMVSKSTRTDVMVPSTDLYSPLFNNTNLNQLTYSGGNTQLLRIPLQMNYPNSDEILRSQDILVTPYNRVKYSTSYC